MRHFDNDNTIVNIKKLAFKIFVDMKDHRAIKADDTVVDMLEGKKAGLMYIGVVREAL